MISTVIIAENGEVSNKEEIAFGVSIGSTLTLQHHRHRTVIICSGVLNSATNRSESWRSSNKSTGNKVRLEENRI